MGVEYAHIQCTSQTTDQKIMHISKKDRVSVGGMARNNSKSLKPEQLANVKTFVRKLLQDRFKGNQSAMAKALGVDQGTISRLVNTEHYSGVGFDVLDALSRATGKSGDEIRGVSLGYPALGDMPGWSEAEKVARERMPGLPVWVFDKVRKIRGVEPPKAITPEYIIDTALWMVRHTPYDEYAANTQNNAQVNTKLSPKTQNVKDQ